MITIKKISINELPKLVALSYEKDEEFFAKYHGDNSTYIACVNAELLNIYQMAEKHKMDYYKVVYMKKPIGYFVACDDICLYSFSINMRFRKKEILIKWFSEIKKQMKTGFWCCLYQKNTRAISFLEKNRMKIVETNDDNKTVTLVNY